MKIMVDSDGLPKMIKEILFRAAERLKIKLLLVANTSLAIPKSPLISQITVENNPDQADHKIVELTEEGDLVITSDIPLAARVISRNGHVISQRGELYTKAFGKEFHGKFKEFRREYRRPQHF